MKYCTTKIKWDKRKNKHINMMIIDNISITIPKEKTNGLVVHCIGIIPNTLEQFSVGTNKWLIEKDLRTNKTKVDHLSIAFYIKLLMIY